MIARRLVATNLLKDIGRVAAKAIHPVWVETSIIRNVILVITPKMARAELATPKNL